MIPTSDTAITANFTRFFRRFFCVALALGTLTSSALGAPDDSRSKLASGRARPESSRGENGASGKWKVLAVGVNKYEDKRINPLRYSEKDARDVADAFVKLGASEDDVLIVDFPSKRSIERACEKFFASLEPGDRAVVFFSGHGMQFDAASGGVESFFVPNDCDFDDKETARETAVSIDRVLERLKESRAAFKWIIVDACRNDPSKSSSPFRGAKGLNFASVPDSVVLLQSCKEGYVSYEGDGRPIENSLFTHSLLEALDPSDSPADADGNGAVSLFELVDYVAAATDSLAKEQVGVPQKPYLRGDTTSFILFDGLGKSNAVKAQELFDEANRLADEKKYAEAREKMKEVLELEPNDQRYKAFDKRLAEIEELLKRANETAASVPTPSTSRDSSRETPASARQAGERRVLTIAGVDVAFRWCPAGRFTMGSPEDEEGRYSGENQHEVILTKGFWLAETETTQELWKAVMGKNPSNFKGDDLLPVENVSWDDCQRFIEKLNSFKNAGSWKFRLPTEAEWEYACRAGTKTAYPWGNALNGDNANCNGNYPCGTETKGKYLEKTTRVGSYDANAWGLLDMAGNVREWCADWYGDYSRKSVDPKGPDRGPHRVLRGGCWCNVAGHCRSAYRGSGGPADRVGHYGVRAAMTDESEL